MRSGLNRRSSAGPYTTRNRADTKFLIRISFVLQRGRTSEQRRLLNNREEDRRGRDKDDFDGNAPATSADKSAPEDASKKRRKKKSEGRKPSIEEYGCEHVEYHRIDSYFKLPNNLCEQRMKPIKLDLKSCQNIGSEKAAGCAAFMHSLMESCKLNGKDPFKYLLSLFRTLRNPPPPEQRRRLLPDQWVPEC